MTWRTQRIRCTQLHAAHSDKDHSAHAVDACGAAGGLNSSSAYSSCSTCHRQLVQDLTRAPERGVKEHGAQSNSYEREEGEPESRLEPVRRKNMLVQAIHPPSDAAIHMTNEDVSGWAERN
eukprot:SAG31_NODE_15725_length_741_cov_1.098131_1_plen_120_part_01